jgi:hypothetical protein
MTQTSCFSGNFRPTSTGRGARQYALATQAQHNGRPGLVAGTVISSAPANGAAPLSEDTITPLFRGTLRTVAPRH